MSFTMPKNVYCTFEKNCLGVECCVGLELSFLTKTYKIWVNIDPCSSPIKLSMGVGMNSYQFELNSNGSDSEFVKIVFQKALSKKKYCCQICFTFPDNCLNKQRTDMDAYFLCIFVFLSASGVEGEIIVNSTSDTSLGGISVMLK